MPITEKDVSKIDPVVEAFALLRGFMLPNQGLDNHVFHLRNQVLGVIEAAQMLRVSVGRDVQAVVVRASVQSVCEGIAAIEKQLREYREQLEMSLKEGS